MVSDVIIEPMSRDFLLWRGLHYGPVTKETIDQWPCDDPHPYLKENQDSQEMDEFLTQLEQQAKEAGIELKDAKDLIRMRYDL